MSGRSSTRSNDDGTGLNGTAAKHATPAAARTAICARVCDRHKPYAAPAIINSGMIVLTVSDSVNRTDDASALRYQVENGADVDASGR